MSRVLGLARTLRNLREEHAEILEKKAIYDHDANRVVVALSRFNSVVEKSKGVVKEESLPQQQAQQQPLSEEEISKKIEQETNDDNLQIPHLAWAKKAYRSIAMKTHPDRINLDPNISDVQRDYLLSLYKEATASYNQRNYQVLAEIAAELDIKVDIPDEEFEKALESKISSIRKDCAALQRTISWIWGSSYGDVSVRLPVLKRCCQLMKIQQPQDKDLLEIIKELESTSDFDIIDRLGRVKRIKAGVERRKTGERPVKMIRRKK